VPRRPGDEGQEADASDAPLRVYVVHQSTASGDCALVVFKLKNVVYGNSIGENTNGALQIGPMLPGGEGVRRRVRAPLAIAPCVPALWQGPVQGRCAAVAVWRNFYLLSFCLLPLGVSTYTRPRPIQCPTRAPCREAAELTWAVGARPWRRRRRVRSCRRLCVSCAVCPRATSRGAQ
jgi:hypothetical protein